jgi:gliding motility-associated-like protein
MSLLRKVAYCLFLFSLPAFSCLAQIDCPVNIGVESGSFANWNCFVGNVSPIGGVNDIKVTAAPPTATRHAVYSNIGNTEVDQYGKFPLKCPDGSNYSIRLGNNQSGNGAERISYSFTIPAGSKDFSLTYWYAVVSQNPDHQPFQQPRFIASVFDEGSGNYVDCASFTYVGSSGLPGFEVSTVNREVIFKRWTPVTVALGQYAGRTMRIEFTTADCTQGGHFGYAYLDIEESCSEPIRGAVYCGALNTLELSAPYGYRTYNWYNSDFSYIYGSEQNIRVNAPNIKRIAVELIPYEGFGCRDTVFTDIRKGELPPVFAGNDTSICPGNTVNLGGPGTAGLKYSWTPTLNLTTPAASSTVAKPEAETTYALSATDGVSGCTARDSVLIRILAQPVASFNIASACTGSTLNITNLTTYSGSAALSYSWTFGDGSTSTSPTPTAVINRPGAYAAELRVSTGECPSTSTATKAFTISAPPPSRSVSFSTITNEPITISTSNKGISYNWKPATSLDRSTIANPVFTGSVANTYQVDIVTASGCSVVDNVTVKVEKESTILVPSGFTPNGDNKNERVFPILLAIKQLTHFKVWNRWGQLVYQSTDALPGWDGRLSGVPQPAGTYVWEAVGISVLNRVIQKKGLIVLIR